MAVLQANSTLSGSFAEVWVDGAEERYSISNVAFTELPFINYKIGQVNQQKLPFSFRPSDPQCLDNIPEAE